MSTERERRKVTDEANKWAELGTYEWNDNLNHLINVYNSHTPLARGLKYTPSLGGWCAVFVSACYILAGLSDLIVTEMGAAEFKLNAEKTGHWKSRESGYIPQPGDIMVLKYPEHWHVGVVTNADESVVYTTEGNVAKSVVMCAHKPTEAEIKGYYAPDFPEDKEYNINELLAKLSKIKEIATI